MKSKGVSRKSVLFVFTSFSSFVKNDFHTISGAHQVEKYHFKPVRGIWRNAMQMIRQLFFLLLFGWKYDSFYCWFADYHSFLPVLFAKIFRKRSVVVIGGYDVCRIRKLNYGAFCSPFRGWFCASSMRMASSILTVSNHVDRKAKAIAPKTRRKMIYNCVNLQPPELSTDSKTDLILTVGLIDNERTYNLKGIDTFIETARLLPGFKFEIVGLNAIKLAHKLRNLPANLKVYEKVEPDELVAFYRRTKIYMQLSRSESFGVSIAEAMTFGAFPIVTAEGGMPEVVGKAGIVAPRDPHFIAQLISDRILKGGNPDINTIRKQVSNHFSRQQRAESILGVIDGI